MKVNPLAASAGSKNLQSSGERRVPRRSGYSHRRYERRLCPAERLPRPIRSSQLPPMAGRASRYCKDQVTGECLLWAATADHI